MDVCQFVDSIASAPAVRLDLNDDVVWGLSYDGTDFSPPDLRRAVAQTLLTDGGQVTAAAYDNRLLRLRLEVKTATTDELAGHVQTLLRELNRPTNLLKWQPGTSAPVFFRTMRSPVNRVTELPGSGTFKVLDVEVLAEPFAYGLKETLPAVTVYNDPHEGTTLNANPYAETDASDWTAFGGTITRSTAQAHQGTASLLVTPSGSAASAEATTSYVPVMAGRQYRLSAWVRCDAAREVRLMAIWSNGSTETGDLGTTVAVAATTWTLIDTVVTAPAGAVQARMSVAMSSTPPGTHLLHVDEARLRAVGGAGGTCFDVAGIKGDVETPLHLRLSASSVLRQPVIAVRRRGIPSQAPFVLQAETMTPVGADTALAAANDPAMSGSGPNYLRTTFATSTAMLVRAMVNPWPAAPSEDVRGTYRVLARVRRNTGSDAINLQLVWGNGTSNTFGDVVALPSAPYTDPIYVDLGFVQFPTGQDPVTDGMSGEVLPVQGMYIGLQAQRATGAGSLDVDFLAFVPADDRLMIATIYPDSGAAAQVVDSARTAVYGVGAAGEVRPAVPAQIVGGPPMVSPGQVNRIVYLPSIVQGVVALALTDTTQVTPYYWPRYLYTRPVSS